MLLKDYKTMLASFELQPRSSLARLLRQMSGSRLPSNEFIEEKINSLDGKLYLYDQQGTVGVESIISVIYYSAEVLSCKIVIVDSLMKCGVAEDDYEGQKKFIDRKSKFDEEYKKTLLNFNINMDFLNIQQKSIQRLVDKNQEKNKQCAETLKAVNSNIDDLLTNLDQVDSIVEEIRWKKS